MSPPRAKAAAEPASVKSILAELKSLGSETYKNTMLRHGATEPIYGVSIADLKKIQKRVKTNHELALGLYDSGVSEAMYLAGMIVDDARMSKADLQRWIKKAPWKMICEYTVPGVAADGPHGWEMGHKWIDDKSEAIASAGWMTLSLHVAVTGDESLDLAALKRLLARVEKSIHTERNRVRYAMNGFVISLGCYVAPLTAAAIAAAKKIGAVEVDMGDTACQVPSAVEYIEKVRQRGSLGKKRKTAKC